MASEIRETFLVEILAPLTMQQPGCSTFKMAVQ